MFIETKLIEISLSKLNLSILAYRNKLIKNKFIDISLSKRKLSKSAYRNDIETSNNIESYILWYRY